MLICGGAAVAVAAVVAAAAAVTAAAVTVAVVLAVVVTVVLSVSDRLIRETDLCHPTFMALLRLL